MVGKQALNHSYTVLLYHGVHEDDLSFRGENSSGKHIPASRFDSEMRFLKENFAIVTMSQIAEAHLGLRDIPDNAVAVTFDDGFENNYSVAWPILERYGISATIYLATGFIGTKRLIWTDRLEASILATTKPNVDVQILGVAREYSLAGLDARIAALKDIKSRLKSADLSERERVVLRLESDLERVGDPNHPLYRFMTWENARTMARSCSIEFGAHTVDHVALTRVSAPERRRQVENSLKAVAENLGETCELFAYPEGQDADIDDDAESLLQDLGLTHCPMAVPGINSVHSTNPFRISRYMVGIDGQPFPLTEKGHDAHETV